MSVDSVDGTFRPNTCILDWIVDGQRRCVCGHGTAWELGRGDALCSECVLARCEHPKTGVPVEQGRLL